MLMEIGRMSTIQIFFPHQTFPTYIWISILAMPNANGNTITVVTT